MSIKRVTDFSLEEADLGPKGPVCFGDYQLDQEMLRDCRGCMNRRECVNATPGSERAMKVPPLEQLTPDLNIADIEAMIARKQKIANDFARRLVEEQASGRKFDQGKPRWDLLPYDALSSVVDVLTHGAEKYSPDNWRQVEDWHRRYFAAAQRHLVAYFQGNNIDDDSGLPHLAHAACCVLFLLAKELES